MELNHRELRELIRMELRKIQAIEDIAETLEGILINLERKYRGGGDKK
tara:strand:- start:1231 stop:1374 length:144 start_codon:yes stop_codon:yes gene_type:complete